MTGDPPGADGAVASLRSGRDWAAWLRQAHTAGRPLPPRQPPDGIVPAAFTALTHLARRQGFAVERTACPGQGTTSWPGRRIQIPPGLTGQQAVTALAHQLGHVLLHGHIARLTPGGTIPCDGLRKVEADSIAYLTATRLGLDPAITFPHISSWAGTDPRARPARAIQAAATRILGAATTITSHLDSERHPGTRPVSPAAAERAETLPIAAGDVPGSVLVPVIDAAAAFFRSRLSGSWVPGYLARRGFSPDVQLRWQAGYAPASWHSLTRHLQSLGIPDRLIEASGLARPSRRGTLIDTFRDRAILPIRTPDGTTIAFIGRALATASTGTPKYLNSPQTILYGKGSTLFGLCEARKALAAGAQPVIVEGPLDAIAVTTASQGCYAGVAPCGTAFTAAHAAALSRAADLPARGVLVAFDPDRAGHAAAVRAYQILSPLTPQLTAVALPKDSDPASLLADHGPARLSTTLTDCRHPLADLVTDAELQQWDRWLTYADGRISALRAVAPLIAAMPPDHVARQVARLSARLDLDHATVTEAVTDALSQVIQGTPRSAVTLPASRRPAGEDGSAAPADPGHDQQATQRGPPAHRGAPGNKVRHDFPAGAQAAARPGATRAAPARRSAPRAQSPSRSGRIAG